jgi:hypothetical protein
LRRRAPAHTIYITYTLGSATVLAAYTDALIVVSPPPFKKTCFRLKRCEPAHTMHTRLGGRVGGVHSPPPNKNIFPLKRREPAHCGKGSATVLAAYTDSLGEVSPAYLGSAPDLAHSLLPLVFGKTWG